MLKFYVAPKPHDYIREGMISDAVPAGNFYIKSLDMVPRSVLATKFVVETNVREQMEAFGKVEPVKIYINDVLVRKHLPKTERDVVEFHLAPPPGSNNIYVTNGVDVPVNLTVYATYMVTLFDMLAEQLYEVAGRINERYLAYLKSPWAAFIIDWLLPFSKQLPDVRSVRSIALKSTASSMFGFSGSDGAVRAMISAFSSTTPVVHRSHNPSLWQPELYQPYLGVDDILGWDFHVWTPNLCVHRWVAFTQYMNNHPKWEFVRGDEHVVLLKQKGAEYYQQHVFDNTARGCSLRSLLATLGCMDRLTISGSMTLTAQPSFCMWAHAFDQVVEHPGIGGGFFDSGEEFDGGWPVGFDTLYDIDLKTDYWVGTSLSTALDGSHCFDTYTDTVVVPQNQDCCYAGPDARVLTTMRLDATVASPVKPNHPLYGGDAPGLLPDPYFGILG